MKEGIYFRRLSQNEFILQYTKYFGIFIYCEESSFCDNLFCFIVRKKDTEWVFLTKEVYIREYLGFWDS